LAFECQGDIGRCTLYKPLALEKGVGEILANCHVMQNGSCDDKVNSTGTPTEGKEAKRR